ncbi:MAG: hypothetical protein HOC91_09505 [Nitrospinaceae bacterium]|nr:hypothetical protein [Nitrospinaceae bacterium]MBT6717529.1 hypothetical protein [Nitrospina sp.]
MDRKKFIIFALAGVLISFFSTVGFLAGVDYYLHKKYERSGGYNIWGYRGPTATQKESGEQRIVVLGGSTALGYGQSFEDSFPVYLEDLINEKRKQSQKRPISIANLAGNNEGAHAFLFALRDYEYLNYDIALMYTGYNDLGGANNQVFRHNSAVYRLIGWLPILPIIAMEKYYLLRYGSVEAGYVKKIKKADVKPVAFTGMATRKDLIEKAKQSENKLSLLFDEKKMIQTSIRENEAAQQSATTKSLNKRLRVLKSEISKAELESKRLKTTLEKKEEKVRKSLTQNLDQFQKKQVSQLATNSCGVQFSAYCESVKKAVKYMLARGRKVIIVTQPYIAKGHKKQQNLLWHFLDEQFPASTLITKINLGKTLNIKDRRYAFDGMHLTSVGNKKIAEALLEPTLKFLN